MRSLIFFLMVFSIMSCNQRHDHSHHAQHSSESESPLYNEVMAIHDAVMPEMSTIHQLKKDLKAIETPTNRDIVLDQIKSLNDADEAMMSWMAAFKKPDDLASSKEYLEAEKAKIQAVSDQMWSAIKDAKSLIDSLSNSK